MSDSKENYFRAKKSDYIRYLNQEGRRKGVHTTPNFYRELIKFINTAEGEHGFMAFCNVAPQRFGLTPAIHISQTIKKVFPQGFSL